MGLISRNSQKLTKFVYLQYNLKLMRQIKLVATTRPLKSIPEDEDFAFWLSKPVIERLRAITLIVSQSLEPGQRMDKSKVNTKKISDTE